MSIHAELVLAGDVEIFAVAELPPETRARVPHEVDDFVVSRTRSRDTSRVVDRESRDLLLEFRRPTRIIDAVIRFATPRGMDPHATLDRAFPMLHRIYRASLLVAPVDRVEGSIETALEPGVVWLGLTLGPRVQELDDTEVFFARDEDGRAAAMKVVRAGIVGVEREASAMRLAGSRTPQVYGVHEWNGRGVLVSEWISGDEATVTAAALRGQRGMRTEAGLLALCCDIADAFGEIHRAGVLQGDVHPHNVLVEESGRARIIDLGFAVEIESSVSHAERGGVAFYLEPELASERLHGRSAPATASGEQFAVGALLYLLWTGVHYLDFSLERTAMLRQIVEGVPVAFARRRVPAWPALEAVLGRALAKTPEMRFGSCSDLADALRTLLHEARRRDETALEKPTTERDRGRDLATAFFDRCGIGGSLLREKPLNPPFASVNYGAAGIGYAMYKLAVARDDARLLATADAWAHKAAVLSCDPEAFHTSAIAINEKTVGHASLFHSAAGIHAVRALVALSRGEAADATRAASDLVNASRAPCEFIDVTLGKAGLLLGIAEILEAMQGARDCDAAAIAIVTRGDEIRDEIRRVVDESAIATATSMSNLGFAHGWAGLLFALLRWSQAREEDAEPYRAKLDELAALHEPHGTKIRWPVSNRAVARRSYADGWCSGAAGHALLWALAHECLGDSEYVVYAERSAAAAWSSDTTLGTVCCGLAGIGYACAAAHRVTGDAAWLERAVFAARRACEDRSPWFYRDSLYKGAVGAVLLREELETSRAATPFVER